MNKSDLGLNHIAKSLKQIVHGLIYLYILTIPFQAVGFRFMGLEFGPPELVFFVLTLLATIQIINSRQKLCVDRLDLFVLGWLFANILAG